MENNYDTWFDTLKKLKKDVEHGTKTGKQIEVAMKCQKHLIKFAEENLAKQEKPIMAEEKKEDEEEKSPTDIFEEDKPEEPEK